MLRAGARVRVVMLAPDAAAARRRRSERAARRARAVRVGQGWDIHRLVAGRPLRLGGVEVPYERGLLGHSDGDVVLHAVTDALLGAIAAGDIGQHFPDTDPRYRGVDSARAARARSWQLVRAARLPRRQRRRHHPRRAAEAGAAHGRHAARAWRSCSASTRDQVGIKAKTMEGLGAIGAGEAIARWPSPYSPCARVLDAVTTTGDNRSTERRHPLPWTPF